MSTEWTPFFIFTMSAFAVMTVITFVNVTRLHRHMRAVDTEDFDRDAMRRDQRRMLWGVGAWQVTIGLVLIAAGSSASSYTAVMGMGLLLIIAATYNVFTGLR